jgi:hypothetical protein
MHSLLKKEGFQKEDNPTMRNRAFRTGAALSYMRLVVLPQCAWALWRLFVAHQSSQLEFLRISNLSRIRASGTTIHLRQPLCPFHILGWDRRARVGTVEVDEHVREEEHEEGEAVEH